MSRQKAGRLRFIWIAFATGVITLYSCIRIIIGSYFIKNFRESVDNIMLNWAVDLLKLVNVKVKVLNIENMPKNTERPVIVMCSHSSLYDIPVSVVALKTSLRMLTKKELFRIPVFSTALRKGGFLSIDRKNREQSIKDLQTAKTKMQEGIILWVAPEGTRSPDGQLAAFKRGGFHVALDTNAIIVPIAVRDIHKLQAGSDLSLYLGQEIEVKVCEPVDAANYTIETRRELVEQVRQNMLVGLNQTEGNQ